MHAAVGSAAGSIPEEVMAEREFNRTGTSTTTGPKKASPRKADTRAANVAHSDSLTGASFRRSLRSIVPGGSSPKRSGHTNGSSDARDIEMGAVPQEVCQPPMTSYMGTLTTIFCAVIAGTHAFDLLLQFIPTLAYCLVTI